MAANNTPIWPVRVEPHSLIHLWKTQPGFYKQRTSLAFIESTLTLDEVRAQEDNVARWDGGERYIWNRATREKVLPSIQAAREVCAAYYLSQLQAAMEGKQVEPASFLYALRWVLTVNPKRFKASSAFVEGISIFRDFFMSPPVGMESSVVSAILFYWEDEQRRHDESTVYLHLSAAYWMKKAGATQAQKREGARMLRRAEMLDRKASAIYLALQRWDAATSGWGRLAAWVGMVYRCGYFMPAHARAFYLRYHAANVAESLVGAHVSAVTATKYEGNALGDGRVSRLLKRGKEMVAQLMRSSGAVVTAAPDTETKITQVASASKVAEVFAVDVHPGDKDYRRVVRAQRARMKVLLDKQAAQFQAMATKMSKVWEYVERQEGAPFEKIKGLLEASVSLVNMFHEYGQEHIDPLGLRGEQPLLTWCAQWGAALEGILQPAQVQALYLKLENRLTSYLEEISTPQEKQAVGRLFWVMKGRLLLPMSAGDAVLFAAYEKSVTGRCGLPAGSVFEMHLKQLEMLYQAAIEHIRHERANDKRRLTVGEVLHWRAELSEAVRHYMSGIGAEDGQQEALIKRTEQLRGELREEMQRWFGEHAARWEREQKSEVAATLERLKQETVPANVSSMDDFMGKLRAYLAFIEGQAKTYVDGRGFRGRKRLFEWWGEVAEEPFKKALAALDIEAEGIAIQLRECFAGLIGVMDLTDAAQVHAMRDKLKSVKELAERLGWEGGVVEACEACLGQEEAAQQKLKRELKKAKEEECEQGWWKILEKALEAPDKTPYEIECLFMRYRAETEGVEASVRLVGLRDFQEACDVVSEWLATRAQFTSWSEQEVVRGVRQWMLRCHPDKQLAGMRRERSELGLAIFRDARRQVEARKQQQQQQGLMEAEEVDVKSLPACLAYVESLEAYYHAQYDLSLKQLEKECDEDESLRALREEVCRLRTELYEVRKQTGLDRYAGAIVVRGEKPVLEGDGDTLFDRFVERLRALKAELTGQDGMLLQEKQGVVWLNMRRRRDAQRAHREPATWAEHIKEGREFFEKEAKKLREAIESWREVLTQVEDERRREAEQDRVLAALTRRTEEAKAARQRAEEEIALLRARIAALEGRAVEQGVVRETNPLGDGVDFEVRKIAGDGNCLYAAIADQLEVMGDARGYTAGGLRGLAVAKMREAHARYAAHVAEDMDGYLERQAQEGTWGGELEIEALGEALQVKVHVYDAKRKHVIVYGAAEAESGIYLRYNGENHYDSMRRVAPAAPAVTWQYRGVGASSGEQAGPSQVGHRL